MFPRKVGSAWEVCTPAKLNLYLEILNRQDSGFHELETLMVPIRLVDSIRWTPGPFCSGLTSAPRQQCSSLLALKHSGELSLRVFRDIRQSVGLLGTGLLDFDVPADDNNLVLRAAHLLARRAGIQPYGTFTLYKRIPTRAGLGGGSSDAAATLMLANAAWKLGYTQAQLLELAAELGSDVPFFVAINGMGDAAICRGRGECVEPIGSLGCLHFVLVKPSVGLTTAEIFKQVDLESIGKESRTPAPLHLIIAALRRGALREACQSMSNRLESIAMANCEHLRCLREAFRQCFCCGQWMTGSGSTYVGLVRTVKQARHVAGMLRARQVGTVITTMSY